MCLVCGAGRRSLFNWTLYLWDQTLFPHRQCHNWFDLLGHPACVQSTKKCTPPPTFRIGLQNSNKSRILLCLAVVGLAIIFALVNGTQVEVIISQFWASPLVPLRASNHGHKKNISLIAAGHRMRKMWADLYLTMALTEDKPSPDLVTEPQTPLRSICDQKCLLLHATGF